MFGSRLSSTSCQALLCDLRCAHPVCAIPATLANAEKLQASLIGALNTFGLHAETPCFAVFYVGRLESWISRKI